MNKSILQDYVDACELIRETEEDIRKLQRRKRIVQDSVKGSMHEFPYAPQSFHIEGSPEEASDKNQLWEEEKLLEARKSAAEKIKLQVEQWMLKMPTRMQRIIRFKYFKRLCWEEVAVQMGGKATADSVRMELNNFITGEK